MYYKATRPDGKDFYSGTVDYAAALASGEVMKHPRHFDGRKNSDHAVNYFSVATVATDCTGMSWPCRLFEVEPVSRVWTPNEEGLPNKRATRALRVVRELDAVDALGPQSAQLVDLIGQAAKLTEPQANELVAARAAAWAAAWAAAGAAAGAAVGAAAWDAAWAAAGAAAGAAVGAAARDAAWAAARVAAWVAARDAAWDAAWALSVRDLISETGFTQAHYDLLTGPWVSVIGPLHPEDVV